MGTAELRSSAPAGESAALAAAATYTRNYLPLLTPGNRGQRTDQPSPPQPPRPPPPHALLPFLLCNARTHARTPGLSLTFKHTCLLSQARTQG